MPSTIGKCKLFRIKHTILLEGETFLRNKHEIAFFLNKVHIFLLEKKTPLNWEVSSCELSELTNIKSIHSKIKTILYTWPRLTTFYKTFQVHTYVHIWGVMEKITVIPKYYDFLSVMLVYMSVIQYVDNISHFGFWQMTDDRFWQMTRLIVFWRDIYFFSIPKNGSKKLY